MAGPCDMAADPKKPVESTNEIQSSRRARDLKEQDEPEMNRRASRAPMLGERETAALKTVNSRNETAMTGFRPYS